MGADKKPVEDDTTEQPKTSSSKLALLISQAIASELAPMKNWQKKVNGELADRRRGGKSPDEAQTDEPEKKAPAASRAALTDEDLDAAVEVGELRAKLPKALLEQVSEMLEGKSHRERRDALRLLSLGQGGRGETPTKSRDPESAPTRTPRGSPPPVTNSVPRPRSLQEYRLLAKNDPKAFTRLNEDPDFDPTDLPAMSGL